MRKHILLFPLLFFINLSLPLSAFVNHWETVIYNNDSWKYYIGSSEPDANWRALSFNDAAWLEGKGGFGYNESGVSTTIGQCISFYVRKKFNVVDTGKIEMALLHVDFDDAFIAYINNVEVARFGIDGVNPPYSQMALSSHEANMPSGGIPDAFILSKNVLKTCLVNSENVLTIQVHNTRLTSDISINAFLSFGMEVAGLTYRSTPSWFSVFSSNLPIVAIQTENRATILEGTKINATMKIIDNSPSARNNFTDPANVYNGNIGIEIRGATSSGYPQKPYGIETRDGLGNNLDVSILGMPRENDWILLANYNDKAFVRNTLTYKLFNEMGHYASRTRYCEVFINEEYQGIFVLAEKIKRDDDRVNIAKLDLDDNAGDSITGGYIFKNDNASTGDTYWSSNYLESGMYSAGAGPRFIYHDPKSSEITAAQKNYIKAFVNSFEQVLYSSNFSDFNKGYWAYIDVNSFVDYFIIGELSRNVDTYKKSRFLFKDKDSKGGLLNAGPAWDYDWAYKNIPECTFGVTDGSGWAYKAIDCSHYPAYPGWIPRLMKDTNFVNLIKTRYVNLRQTTISNSHIFSFIDSVHVLLEEAQARHYNKWKILGVSSAGSPEIDAQPTTYDGLTNQIKLWITTRLKWLDTNMPGRFLKPPDPDTIIPPDTIRTLVNISKPAIFRVFPNPAHDIVYFESDKRIMKVEISDFTGHSKLILPTKAYSLQAELRNLSKGMYIVKLILENGETKISKLVKK